MSVKDDSDVVILGSARTAVGNFGGSLAAFSASRIGMFAASEALRRSGVAMEEINEVIFGNVLQAAQGQNPARQMSMATGIPATVPSLTINMVCGSGLRSVSLAAQTIAAGDNQLVLSGGMESMSQCPYYMKDLRWGGRMGNQELVDGMVHDGLWDVFNSYHMGITAENLADKYGISREEQDAFAFRSQQKAEAAQKKGVFDQEIVPITLPQKKGLPIVFRTDEFPRHGCSAETLAKLHPAFKKDGTVTAGNASGINDGAAAIVLSSARYATQRGHTPSARIVAYASAGVDPSIMGIGPVDAVRKALAIANLTIDDIDLIEANEAFAAQSLAVARDLNFDMDKVNVNGGAIALGHPIGASGARILVTLLHEITRREVRYGLATLCIGGGMGTCVIVERL